MSVETEIRDRVVVIGLGNPDRGDDGAGLEVARRLRRRELTGVRVLDGPGDLTTLLDLWAGAETVILADAVSSAASPGTLHRIDATSQSFPALQFRSSHSVDLRAVIELARLLDRLPCRLLVYGIECGDCAHGRDLSPEVDRAVVETVKLIASEASRPIQEP